MPVAGKSGIFRAHCSECRTKYDKRPFCSRCRKPRDGSHGSYCRSCYRQYDKEWDRLHPESVPRRTRNQKLKRYGLTETTYAALLVSQGGGCAICGATAGDAKSELHIDHDHRCCPTETRSCGSCVRGLVCGRCNAAMGNAGDDPVRLHALADYIERYSSS